MSHPWLMMKSLKPWRRERFSPVQMGTREDATRRFQLSEYSGDIASSSHTGLIASTASDSCIDVLRSNSQWQWTIRSWSNPIASRQFSNLSGCRDNSAVVRRRFARSRAWSYPATCGLTHEFVCLESRGIGLDFLGPLAA